jgi:hypothetical protein
MKMEIQDSKKVWVAWTNTDRTEGRGYQVPFCVAESYEAAIRLGRKGGVQGCDCNVTEEISVNINNQWLAPAWIRLEIAEDRIARKSREEKELAITKALHAGLTDSDIAALRL